MCERALRVIAENVNFLDVCNLGGTALPETDTNKLLTLLDEIESMPLKNTEGTNTSTAFMVVSQH